MAAVHAQDHLLAHQRSNELIAQTHFGDCECCISVEVEVSQQRKTCEALEREVNEERRKSNQLAVDLQHAVTQNAHLTRQLGELHGKLSLLDQVLEECRQLRDDFSSQRQILHSTIAERDWLRETVIKLNSDIGLMQAAEEKRLELEREHEQALQDLQERQDEIRRLQQEQEVAKKQHRESVSRLEHKVQDLEKKWLEQCQNFGRLSQELSALRLETSTQLQTLAASPGTARSRAGHNSGQSLGSAAVIKGTEEEKEDWKRIAEEALVARATAELSASAPRGETLVRAKSHDAADVSIGSERSSQRSGGQNGQAESVSDPEDFLDELSDKIDQALLSRLHHASMSSGPISKLAVFIARYNYDPSQDSPNDNYASELPLTAGDYIYVYGDPDEDGFYEGELMDGRRGLVPCNFIERIAEENLPDFIHNNGSQCDDTDSSSSHKMALKAAALVAKPNPVMSVTVATEAETAKAASTRKDHVAGESDLSDLEFNSEDVELRRSNVNHFSGDLAFVRAQSDHPSDLEDIPEVDEDDDNHAQKPARGNEESSLASLSDFGSEASFSVPCPRKLSLDRQLKHSVIMSWVAPDTIAPPDVLEFRVYVDGQYRTATKQGAKTRALVENVEPSTTHRISVRTVTARGMSEDAACMLVIGRDASVAPTNLKASNVGPSSANISWLPGNSNLPHVISVNGEEVRTVKPSIYKHTLSGLQPLSVYRVNVRAKSRKQSAMDGSSPASKNSVEIEFKTLPGGLPDAPLDVQVRQGSNSSMLTIEWLPVTITTSGLSNGAVVMGYAAYANNSKVAETTSPTADRVSVSKSRLRMVSASELVVRTLSPNGCSSDSLPIKVPAELLEERRKDKTSGKVPDGSKAKSGMYSNAEDDESSTSSLSHSQGVGGGLGSGGPGAAAAGSQSEEDSLTKFNKKVAAVPRKDASPREDGGQPKSIVKTEKPLMVRESEYLSDSDRSELSDIQEEVEEELSEFGNASLPGLSDASEGAKPSRGFKSRGADDEKKKVLETLQINTKPALEFDTDPEVESLNKPDKVVPIPIIRSQRDYERETEQSPHNPVLEPVPWKPAKSVPQIEITKDAHHEQYAAARKSPSFSPERIADQSHTSSASSAHNSLPKAQARADPKGQSRTQGQRSSSQWSASPTASSNASNYGKDYDAKSNNDRHHTVDGRPPSEAGRHRRSEGSSHSDIQQRSRHSDNLRTPESSLSQQKSSRGSRSEETFGEEDDEAFSGSEAEELYDDGTIRFFIAMFDYNPAIMSPNVDGAEEELQFKEGDVIKIIGDRDADGFFVGELNGRRGYVPYNMVEEIESPEQTPAVSPAKRASGLGDTHSQDRQRFSESLNTTGSSQVNFYDSPVSPLVIPKESLPHRMRALFDYNPQELSPNPDLDVELSFNQGDILIVYGEMDEDGFFVGELKGQRGLVPSNFLEEISEVESSTTSRSYSPSMTRNRENKHNNQATKDKYALPAQQENGEAQYHGSEVMPVISDSAEQNSLTSTPEHTKKKKGLLSKGKALFKKLGSSDNKQKHK
ncbi:RIMS-binding protein 2-like [Diadema antillarum]|uniref:RIMS-binding protein 2-like n=1 Tax=Diadema antillarum TaxID=105358 RepID=UPI003A8AD582